MQIYSTQHTQSTTPSSEPEVRSSKPVGQANLTGLKQTQHDYEYAVLIPSTIRSVFGNREVVAKVHHFASHWVVARSAEFPHSLLVVFGHAACQTHPRDREFHRPRLLEKRKRKKKSSVSPRGGYNVRSMICREINRQLLQ